MRAFSLTLGVACAFVAVAANAQSQRPSLPAGSGHSFHDGGGLGSRSDRRDSRRRNDSNTAVIMETYGGQWAQYNNSGWQSDSYNDWWHDRPDRAFPRWVQHNQNCTADRMWWSGTGWHC